MEENKLAISVRDLNVYQSAFKSAMQIFNLSKSFPKDEKYSLTDQVRRSSRSVCSNLAEGWCKRKYQAVFVNKLTDAIQEAAETQTWIEFSKACGYIDSVTYEQLFDQYEIIIAQMLTMEKKSSSFCKNAK
jgi:four helix bundle protein